MRRIVLWCLSTLSVLVLLFGYHTSTSSTTASGPASSYRSSLDPGTPAAGGTGASGITGRSGTSGATAQARTVTGDAVDTQWGVVQVEIAVKGGRITQVAVPQRPSGNPTDDQINNYALPVLVQETLDQQSAAIDMVSGATVTSGGYLQSLQSALDQAGL